MFERQQSDDLAGQTLGALGPYRVHARIGEGRLGTVYEAEQATPARRVAIRVVKPELAGDPAFVAWFQEQAQNVARLNHPNILPIYDLGRDERTGALYLVMHHAGAGSLTLHLDGNPWTPRAAVDLSKQVLPALDHAHDRGVVHGSLTPNDILFDRDAAEGAEGGPGYHAFVADFGRGRGPTQSGDDAGASTGSTRYLSPEQRLGQPASGRSDLYAFGLILYEALTGQTPDEAASNLLPPRAINPRLSEDLESVFLTALATDPELRFSTGAALLRALTSAAEVPTTTHQPAFKSDAATFAPRGSPLAPVSASVQAQASPPAPSETQPVPVAATPPVTSTTAAAPPPDASATPPAAPSNRGIRLKRAPGGGELWLWWMGLTLFASLLVALLFTLLDMQFGIGDVYRNLLR